MTEPVQTLQQLSATERLAVALFGWTRNDSRNDNPERYREYSQTDNDGSWRMARHGLRGGGEMFSDRRWPNFTHARDQHYWVSRMEGALAERGLLPGYMGWLECMWPEDRPEEWKKSWSCESFAALRATTSQRVAAAIRVLDGEGL